MNKRTKAPVLLVAGVAVVLGLAAVAPGLRSRVPLRTGTPAGGPVQKTDADWRAALTAAAYHVTRQKGTERAYTGRHWNAKGDGVYACVCCEQTLFDSADKYDSGTGWPSYTRPRDEDAVTRRAETGFGDGRTEVVCSRCDAHLGHVFDDGLPPAGLRYCMNSAALIFIPRPAGGATPPPH